MVAIVIFLFLLAIGFDATAWRRFGKANPSLRSVPEFATIVALLSNSVALLLPFAYGKSLTLQGMMNDATVIHTVLGLCILSAIINLLSIKSTRLVLFLGSIATASFWLLVPKATQWP